MKNLLLLLLSLPCWLRAQNTIGFPEVINYSKHVYKAGLQNWDIRQDKNGVIYFANNEGLLSFDGHYWKLYPTPNKTIVHSVEIGNDNRIYVGGQDELGYFLPRENGQLVYHSLTGILRSSEKSFGDVWDIVSFGNDTYFRTSYKIFRLSNESIISYNAPGEWSFLGLCNGELYAHDYKQGVMTFTNNAWLPIQGVSELPAYDPITGILKVRNDSIIITTLKNGLFSLSKNGIVKINMPNSSIFEKNRIYAAAAISDSQLALASNNNGIYITSLKGDIIQGFSRSEQLQNNNVLSIFLDNQHNLWLGLDNGIDFIAYNSAIKHINPMMQDGSGYAAIIHDHHLYTGTSNGLYSVPLQHIDDLGFSKGYFTEVAGSQGQVWSLAHVNNNLFMGHHEGAFLVNGITASPIIKGTGFWNFIPVSPSFPAEKVVSGNYKGLQFLDYKEGRFLPGETVPGFVESSRFVAIDAFQDTWVSHPYHGVYRLRKNADSTYSQTLYSDKQGLPSLLNNHIYKIKNRLLMATVKGVYAYNPTLDRFGPDPFYGKMLGSQGIRYLHEDVAGNTWFMREKTIGVVDVSGKQPVVIYLPELTGKMISGFEFMYCYDQSNIFLGAENGFYHINYNKYTKTIPDLKVQVRGVTIIDNKDSLLFGGYFKNVNEEQVQEKKWVPGISYSWKTIQFEFSSSLFGYQVNLEYSFMLRGFDGNWSEWSKRTEKEYTNLPAGDYTFQVKVRSNLGNESPVASYSLTILPPWYQTVWAKLGYLLLVAALFYGIYEWQRRKFIRQQKHHEEEQKRLSYIHDLEISKTESELVAVKNEKLEAAISFKNSELASSAMHLVKKGELLTTIKTELGQLTKRIDNEKAIGELKKMIKSLTEDDHIDKEWENFARHFDTVHSDFVIKLKEKHSNISNNEMKLCAYLRMNLSSKEIAQLMNISVRGVEISRYRLRKKMGIASDVNLFDYLIQFQ